MPKPPLQFSRPGRPETRDAQRDLRPAPSPEIDLNSSEVQAFSLRSRVTVPPSVEDGTGEGARAVAPPAPSPAPRQYQIPYSGPSSLYRISFLIDNSQMGSHRWLG
jgi:hypothetical protein